MIEVLDFQIVMDVCDYNTEVTVKVVEGKEVVVEGKGSRPDGGTFSLCRRYSLYSDTILEDITAVMSSDGILTITIPRKVSKVEVIFSTITPERNPPSH